MSKKQKPARVAATGAKRNTITIVGTILLVLALVAVLTIQPGGKPVSTYTPRTEPSQPTAYMFKKQGELRFLTPRQDFIAGIDIEFAQDESQRQLGLMYRDSLAENQGMLFLFDNEEPRAFWMKNTILSLDMIFVNARNEIVAIHKYTTPYSEETYASTGPAKYVLEVNAGYADKRKLSVGDRISWNRL